MLTLTHNRKRCPRCAKGNCNEGLPRFVPEDEYRPEVKQSRKSKALTIVKRYERIAGPATTTFMRYKPSLRPTPSSVDSSLSSQLIYHLDQLHPHSSWMAMLPMRVGRSAAADHATNSLTRVLEYMASKRTNAAIANAAVGSYCKAVVALRADIDSGHGLSDASLITTALLAIVEMTMNERSETRQKDTFAHWNGMRAILTSRPKDQPMSEVARAIIYDIWDCTCGTALSMGAPSPFDDDRFTQLDPALLIGISDETARLWKVANTLVVRIPRLVSYTRRVREGKNETDKAVEEAIDLAVEMVSLSDDVDESALLHRTKVLPTLDESQHNVLPYSYRFTNPHDLNAVVVYYFGRLMTINCCLKLLEIHPAAADRLDAETMHPQKSRYYMNVMMCWEQACSCGRFLTVPVTKTLLHNWSHLRKTTTWRGMKSAEVLKWVHPRMNNVANPWYSEDVTMEILDEAADMLVGGPLAGFISDAKNRTWINPDAKYEKVVT